MPESEPRSMDLQWNVLVISCRIENRRALLGVLETMPVSVFTAATIEQAREVLSSHTVRLIFCEERVSDGTYRNLLDAQQHGTRLVVMLCTGEWGEYLEALQLGASEVMHCPLQAQEVELAFIHAVREARKAAGPKTTAHTGQSPKSRLSAGA